MRARYPLALAATAVWLAFGTAATGQQGQPGNPSVTFQTEVNYVDVDAIVTDQQGHFVGDLTKDDFQVFEDGKPQKLDMFSSVEIPLVKQDRFLVANRPVTTDARSNRDQFGGRVYVILLDDTDINPMRTVQTRRVAREFVEKYFGANDVAAVAYTSGRTDATQEFTSDPQLLLAAIDKFFGRGLRSAALERLDAYFWNLTNSNDYQDTINDPNSTQQSQDTSGNTSASSTNNQIKPFDPNDMERSFRAIRVLDTLKNLADFLGTVHGRRKAILMFSEGIDYPVTDMFTNRSAGEVLRATEDAVTAAARSNVNFFTIDPRGLSGVTPEAIEMAGAGPETTGAQGGAITPSLGNMDLLAEMRTAQDSLRVLADESGGFAALDRNTMTSAYTRIVDANSRYYVLGYYPPSHPRDGKFHKIEVRVRRPGLKVSARKGYASPRGKTADEKRRDDEAKRARESKNGSADATSPQLKEMLNSPMQQGTLTFGVQAAPFKGADNKTASVALAIEVDGSPLKFKPQNGLYSDAIEISLYGVNQDGKPAGGMRSTLDLNLRPETYQRVRSEGVRLNPRVPLPPGRYQLRIGTRDSEIAGTVFYDLEVPDFTKDPLMISGLQISAPSADQVPTPQPDPVSGKLLPGPATSRRIFGRSDTLSVLAEIYDNMGARPARQIEAAVRLLSEAGQEVFVARDSLTNASDGKKWDIYAYTKQVPLANVAPGRYLLRVEAQVRGNQDNAKPAARETLVTVR